MSLLAVLDLLTLLDLLGVFVFALSAATLAVSRGLDVFGVLVLGGVAATGGGLLRDVLLGDVPPPALLGAVVVVAADGLGLSGQPWAVVAAALVPTLRMLGVWRDGHAPVAPLRRT